MRPDEIKKLLGGYATGTLTEEERRTLFQAALRDQELFDALAGEQPLKELLEDPAARGRLLAVVGERKPTLLESLRAWLAQPSTWAVAGGVAAAFALAVVVIQVGKPPAAPAPTLVAKREVPRRPELESPAAPAAPPLVSKGGAPRAMAPETTAETEREAIPQERQAKLAAVAPEPLREVAESRAETAASVRPAVRQSARQLFYSPPPALAYRALGEAPGLRAPPEVGRDRSKAAVEADVSGSQWRTAVGLRYHVLRGRPAGGYAPADPGAEFRAGDLVRLAVEPNAAGYLGIFRLDATGRWQPVCGTRAEARTRYEIPPWEPIRLVGPPGEVRLLLTLSQTELRETADDSSRDRILVESVAETVAGGQVDVRYAVDPAATPDSPLAVEIRLKFR
jgi:hypothetical protein